MLVRVWSRASSFTREGCPLPTQALDATTRAVLLDRIEAHGVVTLEPALPTRPPSQAVEAGPGYLKGRRLRLDVLPDGALTLIDRIDGVRWPLLATVRKRDRLTVSSAHPGPLVGSVTVDSPGLRLRASLRAAEDRVRLRIEGGPPDRVRFPLGVEPTGLALGDRILPMEAGFYRTPGSTAALGGMRDLAFLTPPGHVQVHRTRRQGFVLSFPLPPVFRCIVCRPAELGRAEEDRRLPVVQVPAGFLVPGTGHGRVRRRGRHLALWGGETRELLVPCDLF